MRIKKSTEVKVGIFVMLTLALGGSLIFLVGQRRNMFSSKVTYHMVFDSVGGLTAGSPVQVAGVTVGNALSVEFTAAGKVAVEVGIVESARSMVRQGAVASLGNKGLLGDRLVDISVGKGPTLAEGSTIPTRQPVDILSYVDKAGGIIDDAKGTAHNLRGATEPLQDGEFAKDMRSAAHDLKSLLHKTNSGDGLMARLFNDRGLAQSVEGTFVKLERVSVQLEELSKNLNQISGQVRTGPGMLHALVYGRPGEELIQNLSTATFEVAAFLNQTRTGEGFAHQLLYEKDAGATLHNLRVITDNINAITDDVRKGHGSLGAIVKDPSLYEDLKRLIGNLERNQVLRALVRYSIRHDETAPSAQVKKAR